MPPTLVNQKDKPAAGALTGAEIANVHQSTWKTITLTTLKTWLANYFAAVLTSDQNYMSDAQIAALHDSGSDNQDLTGLVHANRTALDLVSGTNTGDQTLAGLGGAVKQSGNILGQFDAYTGYTATNGGTTTLAYTSGNSHVIDCTALAAGNAFTIAVNAWPTGPMVGMLTIILMIGANVPTISWPAGVTGPTLQPSKYCWVTLANMDNGATSIIRILSAVSL